MTERQRTRRAYLAAVTVPVVAASAGCSVDLGGDGTPTPDSYEALGDRRVAVTDGLSLSVPDAVTEVDDPAEADVVLLPATTDRAAAELVGWLRAGTRVALVGDGAQETWIGLQDSDAYAEAYPDHRARAVACSGSGSGSGEGETTDCEPPGLLVAWTPPEGPPTTYRRTWGDTESPSDAELFAGLAAAFESE